MGEGGFTVTERSTMSHPEKTPQDEQPLIPRETVPRQETDDPLHEAESSADAGTRQDDTIAVEDLP